ncbi:MAG: RDD family protein, partial [Chloroflexi bacterium]|nr:RDD family protein [Chloroflexota bacterium]
IASMGRRFVALLLDSILWLPTLIIGYIVWSLIVYARGQTPGKQLMGIRAVRIDGAEAGWGLTFVREFLIKGVVFGFISGFTGGIFGLVNYLWPFADRDQQAIHDKVVSTLVVQGPRMGP